MNGYSSVVVNKSHKKDALSEAQTNKWMHSLASRESSYLTRLPKRPHTHTPLTLIKQSVRHSLWLECVFEGECEKGSFEGRGGLRGMDDDF